MDRASKPNTRDCKLLSHQLVLTLGTKDGFRTVFEEWKIRKTLRRFSKQRVFPLPKPGNAWVIELELQPDDDAGAYLQTCLMRVWAEILHDQMFCGKRPADMSNWGPHFDSVGPIHRIPAPAGPPQTRVRQSQ